MCFIAESIVKYGLIIGNFIFCILGLIILGLGVLVHIKLVPLIDLIELNIRFVSIGIMASGSLVFIIAFLACCGSMAKSVCMLITYSISMVIFIGIKIYVTVVTFQFLNDSFDTVSGWINDAFKNENTAIAMQTFFQCCGTTGPGSYGNPTLPPSCCPDTDKNQCQAPDAFGGCTDLVASWFNSYGKTFAWIMIGVIVFEVVCMTFGFIMVNTIRSRRLKKRSNDDGRTMVVLQPRVDACHHELALYPNRSHVNARYDPMLA